MLSFGQPNQDDPTDASQAVLGMSPRPKNNCYDSYCSFMVLILILILIPIPILVLMLVNCSIT